MRTAAINEVIEGAPPLGKRVTLWDALHEALALFGPHQPGDTILLVGDPYDDASHRSPESVEKEFIVNQTRLFMMRRTEGSRVERDFMWQSHDLEKMVLARTTEETGGLLSLYVASLIRFAWAGYMLEIKLPPGMGRPHKWKVGFRGDAAVAHRKTNFYYPARFPACEQAEIVHSKKKAPTRTLPEIEICLAAEQLLLFFLAATLFGGRCGLLFFHLLADFFLALGADLRPLGALGLNHLLTAQQLDVAGCSSIALPPSFVDDAQIAAAAVAKARRHGIK